MTRHSKYVSAREVMRLLDIRRQTLYAYVSRGWISSVAQPGRKDRLYSREDVERVLSRSRARSGHGPVAAAAMNWGEPIITSQITQLTPEGPLYRLRSALDLAMEGADYENVAEFLWTGAWTSTPVRWPMTSVPRAVGELTTTRLRSNDELLELFALVAVKLGMAAGTSTSNAVDTDGLLASGRALLQVMTGCFGCIAQGRAFSPVKRGESIVDALFRILDIEDTVENRRGLGAILVLFADHELSPGALAARVAAASGGTLHNCIAAAISAASGTLHARMYTSVEAVLTSARTTDGLLARVADMQQAGRAIPGFGRHSVYRNGDPRAQLLLDIARERSHQNPRLRTMIAFVEQTQRLNLHPRHELAVIALTDAMKLPAHIAGPLFVLARTAGWIAHVVEQKAARMELRPRAKPSPAGEDEPDGGPPTQD